MKINKWLIIGLVIMAIFITQYKKEGSYITSTSQESCVQYEADYNNLMCNTPCVKATSTISSCMHACDPAYTGAAFGISGDESCNITYNTYRCEFNCLFGGYTFTTSCSDTDGNNINVRGTYTNTHGISINDFCIGDYIVEYWCQNGRPRYQSSLCSSGCSNGACIGGSCSNPGDTNTDCTITLPEVITYANKWVNNQGVTLQQVIAVANIWVSGGSYT